MNIQENYNTNKKEFLYSQYKDVNDHRIKVLANFENEKFDKKNNESLKNIVIADISNFDYFYKPKKNVSKVSLVDKSNYEIEIVNGICKNYEDDNIEIRNFTKSLKNKL